jgi:myo-inositol-1(or 4)-monophosphatase
MTSDLEARRDFACDVARKAGHLGLRFFGELDKLTVESKGHQDLVSEADREVELLVRREILGRFPDDGIIGEEHAPTPGASGFIWVIDPIDGTANFVAGIPAWCVAIACVKDGVAVVGVIHEPSTGETFAAHKGGGAFLNGKPMRTSQATDLAQGAVGTGVSNRREMRVIVGVIESLFQQGGMFYRNASGALMLAYVAAGRLLGYVEEHMNAWDCVAGMLLIEEAGGRVVPPNPETVLSQGTVVVAAGPHVFDKVYALCRDSFGLR